MTTRVDRTSAMAAGTYRPMLGPPRPAFGFPRSRAFISALMITAMACGTAGAESYGAPSPFLTPTPPAGGPTLSRGSPGEPKTRYFIVPPFDRSKFTPVLPGHFNERMLQGTVMPAADANTNASIAILVSNENKLPDQPLIVSFTANNASIAEAEIGVARDYETDCQKPSSQMVCRGNWFVPPSYALAPGVGNPSGCPLVNGDIPSTTSNVDYIQYSVCNGQLIQTINCNVAPQLEDAYDLSLGSSLYQNFSCFRLRGVNNTCGAAGLVRVFWVMGKGGNAPLMYQPPFLKLPFYGSDMNEVFCFKIAAFPSPSPTPTATSTSSRSYSSTASTSFSPTSTRTASLSISFSPSISISRSESVSISFTPSQTGSAPNTPSNTPTYSTTRTVTPTYSPTATLSISFSSTRTSTVSISVSSTSTPSGVSGSQTASVTCSRSYSSTYTPSATLSRSFTSSFTPSPTNLTSLIGAYASLQAHASELAAAKEREQQARFNISSALDDARNERNATLIAVNDAANAAAATAAAEQEDLNRRLGIVAGILALLALIALLCCWWFFLLPCWRRRKKEKEQRAKKAAGKDDSTANPMASPSTGEEALPGKLEVLSSPLEFSHVNALIAPASAVQDGKAQFRKANVAHFNPMAVDKGGDSAAANKRQSTYSGLNFANNRRNTSLLGVDKAKGKDLSALAASDGKQATIMEEEDGVIAAPAPATAAASEVTTPNPDPFATLCLPVDETTAAYMGIDPRTGSVGNFAAYWAYKLYAVDGHDYTAAYEHYAKWIEENGAPTEPVFVGSVRSADSGTGSSNDDDDDIASATGVKRSGTVVNPLAHDSRTAGKHNIPSAASAPPPKKLEVGAGSIRTSVVLRETVSLRRVDTIKGDRSFKRDDTVKSFQAVKERKDVELPSAKKAALSAMTSGSAAMDSPGFTNRTSGPAGAGFSGTGIGGRLEVPGSADTE